MEKSTRTMGKVGICGVALLFAVTAFLGGCAPASESPEPATPILEIATAPTKAPTAIELPDYTIIIAIQKTGISIYPDKETKWEELEAGDTIQFVNATKEKVTVTPSPSNAFTEPGPFSIEGDGKKIMTVQKQKVDTEITLDFKSESWDEAVTGGPRMVVTGSEIE